MQCSTSETPIAHLLNCIAADNNRCTETAPTDSPFSGAINSVKLPIYISYRKTTSTDSPLTNDTGSVMLRLDLLHCTLIFKLQNPYIFMTTN